MSPPILWMLLAIAAAPAFAFLVYRAARELGFLEPPMNRQHELRRTIVLAIYALLLFLPVLVYGFGKRWPRAWVIFGFLDGAALLFFAGSGAWAARELWKIRHAGPVLPPVSAEAAHGGEADGTATSDALAASPLSGPPSGDREPDEPASPPAGPSSGS